MLLIVLRPREDGLSATKNARHRPKQHLKLRKEDDRPATSNIVYRDLVIIPDPGTKKVPTHNARVALEKNKLIVSGFPFDRSWDAVTLKSNIRKQLPNQDMLFQYVKVNCTELFSLNHLNSVNN